MKTIYLCKSQEKGLDCKSRILFEGFTKDYYFCGSIKKVQKCWEDIPND